MLLFARAHSESHKCDKAERVYRAAQCKQAPIETQATSDASTTLCGECLAPLERKRARKTVTSSCSADLHADEQQEEDVSDVALASDAANQDQPAAVGATQRFGSYVAVSERSKTVHKVVFWKDVYTACGWAFQGKRPTKGRAAVVGSDWLACGICFTRREP